MPEPQMIGKGKGKDLGRNRRITGSFIILLGAIFMAPGIFILIIEFLPSTIAISFSSAWMPWIIATMAAFGAFLVFGGTNMIRRRD